MGLEKKLGCLIAGIGLGLVGKLTSSPEIMIAPLIGVSVHLQEKIAEKENLYNLIIYSLSSTLTYVIYSSM